MSSLLQPSCAAQGQGGAVLGSVIIVGSTNAGERAFERICMSLCLLCLTFFFLSFYISTGKSFCANNFRLLCVQRFLGIEGVAEVKKGVQRAYDC